ncbi:MAG: HNH endonuclease [SAR202 cluster bacterium]|nr:HNH endonuclease [SAR202 cluster bacterium]|tara:strand:- start:78 stop:1172 length:1095 start_codon:yes stop_codon:yes gene_type:complete
MKEQNYRKKINIESCVICGLSSEEVGEKNLEVDHINRDRSNNNISNLQVLCKFCHMLKSRFENKDEAYLWNYFQKASIRNKFQNYLKNIAADWITNGNLQTVFFDFYAFIESSEIGKLEELEGNQEAISKYISDISKIKSAFRDSLELLEDRYKKKPKKDNDGKEYLDSRLINFAVPVEEEFKEPEEPKKKTKKSPILSVKFIELLKDIQHTNPNREIRSIEPPTSVKEMQRDNKVYAENLFYEDKEVSVFDLNKPLDKDKKGYRTTYKTNYKNNFVSHEYFLLSNVVSDEVIEDTLYLTFQDVKYHVDFKYHMFEDPYFSMHLRDYATKIYNNKNLRIKIRKPINNDESYYIDRCPFNWHRHD